MEAFVAGGRTFAIWNAIKTYSLSAAAVSSTLDGLQTRAVRVRGELNNAKTYFGPTFFTSSMVTFWILSTNFLQEEKKFQKLFHAVGKFLSFFKLIYWILQGRLNDFSCNHMKEKTEAYCITVMDLSWTEHCTCMYKKPYFININFYNGD